MRLGIENLERILSSRTYRGRPFVKRGRLFVASPEFGSHRFPLEGLRSFANFALATHSTYTYETNADSSPIRSIGPAVGIVLGTGDGLHASRCSDERARACLLPHDEGPVRADGGGGVAWLLPEDSTGRLHQRAGCEDGDDSPGYGRSHLAEHFRAAESERYRRPLG